MATEVRLPQFGEAIEEGTVVGCMVRVGDHVKKGDVIFEIETEKATLEMESPASGFVRYILVELEQTVEVGDVLLVLGEEDEDVPQSFIDSLKKNDSPAGTSEPQALITDVEPEEQHVVSAEDTEPENVVVSKPGTAVALTGRQKRIAEQMVRSKREIPCFYLSSKVDVTEPAKLKAGLGTGETEIGFDAFIIKAVATALVDFPIMTGQIAGDSIELADVINIGFTVAAPKGVVVPVVKDADKKDVTQIDREMRRLTEKALDESLGPDDVRGACITISNPGRLGVDVFIPIVIPGQCSGFGVGRIVEEYMSVRGDTAVRKMMNLSLSVDHKIANGEYAARFLDTVRKLLEDTSTYK
ncbi:MAG TPA: 2-oxo acid dehydrogenase subunit E2 [Planctomycetes bacterium]|nr:2-oxo acid dehydrogenase subunit E2 [Planctomycetota bacterium]